MKIYCCLWNWRMLEDDHIWSTLHTHTHTTHSAQVRRTWVVSLTQQLEEAEEVTGELVILHDLFTCAQQSHTLEPCEHTDCVWARVRRRLGSEVTGQIPRVAAESEPASCLHQWFSCLLLWSHLRGWHECNNNILCLFSAGLPQYERHERSDGVTWSLRRLQTESMRNMFEEEQLCSKHQFTTIE